MIFIIENFLLTESKQNNRFQEQTKRQDVVTVWDVCYYFKRTLVSSEHTNSIIPVKDLTEKDSSLASFHSGKVAQMALI